MPIPQEWCKITPMKILITTKITKDALKMLRLIAAHTGEKQYQVLERVLKKELDEIKENDNKNKAIY